MAPLPSDRMDETPPSHIEEPQGFSSEVEEESKAHNLGLSELSKQLRILQRQNEVQKIEIDRLERQLKLLADLKNVSVADLRSALMQACQAEAHAELQRTVASLQAQLEAATLSNQRTTGSASVKEKSASNDIANLQLRIGELEELEEEHKSEIEKLYGNLADQNEKATRAQARCSQQENEIKQHKDRIKQMLDDLTEALHELTEYEAKVEGLEARVRSQDDQLKEWAIRAQDLQGRAEREEILTKAKELEEFRTKDLLAQLEREREKLKDMQKELRKSQKKVASQKDQLEKHALDDAQKSSENAVEVQVLREKSIMLEAQLKAASDQHVLRNDQFKARFNMQDERIQDLEQQLVSLYAAFELLKKDRSLEDATRQKLQLDLENADHKIATQVHEMEKKSHENTAITGPSSATNIISPRSPRIGALQKSASTISSRKVVSPIGGIPIPDGDVIMSGMLLVRSSGVRKHWKQRRASLYFSFREYQLIVYSSESNKQTSYSAPVGVSVLEVYSKYPFGFVLHVSPNESFFAAAANKLEYDRWISALQMATRGESEAAERSNPPPLPTLSSRRRVQSGGASTTSSLSSVTASGPPMSVVHVPTSAEQEARDLEFAMQISASES